MKWLIVSGAVLILAVLVVGGAVFHDDDGDSPRESVLRDVARPVSDSGGTGSVNPFFGVPCQSNPDVTFVHDVTDPSSIADVDPTITTVGDSRHRAFLNIDTSQTTRVPVYAPVDSELVNGIYKDAKGAVDYDLHFQASCEIWYLINHVTDPVDKIREAFPDVPVGDSGQDQPLATPISFKAGELIGYTTGTPQAANFDFAVFDLDHVNEGLAAHAGVAYSKEKNFICPFDLFSERIKQTYYSKLLASEQSATNCNAY